MGVADAVPSGRSVSSSQYESPLALQVPWFPNKSGVFKKTCSKIQAKIKCSQIYMHCSSSTVRLCDFRSFFILKALFVLGFLHLVSNVSDSGSLLLIIN